MKKNREWDSHDRLFKKLMRIMKLTGFLILFFVMVTHASTYSQATKLNIQVTNGTFVDVLKLIEKQSDFYFYYNNDDIRNIGEVSINVSDKKVEEILDQLLKGTDLEYKVIDKYIALKKKGDSGFDLFESQQQKSVSGKVSDSSGGSLPGVSVVIKGTTLGVITDSNGKYTLSSIPANGVLQFSFVGMKAQEIKIGTQTSINVVLAEESIGLEEVVAVGYGTQKKSDLTGAVSSANIEAFKNSPNINILQSLQGSVAGLNVGPVTKAGESPLISIRGINSISGNKSPVIVLDGIIYYGSLNELPPNDIQAIDVLKDASSLAIYGAQAANGVILVTSKKGKTSDKPIINFNSSYTFQNPAHVLKLLDRNGMIKNVKNIAWNK